LAPLAFRISELPVLRQRWEVLFQPDHTYSTTNFQSNSCVSCNGYRSTVWALQAAVQGLLHGFHVVELHVIKAYRVSPREFSTWQPQGPRIIP
jgi:hypothetical protein